MKRTIATLGVLGLGLISVTAPALAADGITVCHKNGNGYTLIHIPNDGLSGHDADRNDIIPPNPYLTGGLNWETGAATHGNGCVAPAVMQPGDGVGNGNGGNGGGNGGGGGGGGNGNGNGNGGGNGGGRGNG